MSELLLPRFDVTTYVGNGDRFAGISQILKHILDKDRAFDDRALCRCISGRLILADLNVHIPTATSTPSELVRVIVVLAMVICLLRRMI